MFSLAMSCLNILILHVKRSKEDQNQKMVKSTMHLLLLEKLLLLCLGTIHLSQLTGEIEKAAHYQILSTKKTVVFSFTSLTFLHNVCYFMLQQWLVLRGRLLIENCIIMKVCIHTLQFTWSTTVYVSVCYKFLFFINFADKRLKCKHLTQCAS